MQYSLASLPIKTNKTYFCCLIYENQDLQDLSAKLSLEPEYLKSALSHLNKADLGWATFYHDSNHYYFLKCGDIKSFNYQKLQDAIKKLTNFLLEQHAEQAFIYAPKINDNAPNTQLEKIILQIEEVCYQFLDLKTKDKKPHKLNAIKIYLPGASDAAIKFAIAISEGIKLTKTLGNLPANICNPAYLADIATKLDNNFEDIHTKVFNEEKLQKMGMHALLAVAKGSKEYAKLIEIKYNGAAASLAPIVLVGKGITFDSGGISLKPPLGMEEMKYDMCGAASVLGTIKAAALMNLPINIIGLLACAENMPGGNAVKPGDVITSYSGQTIEITNTDAEGRLVLADALTYAERFNPKFVIDIATLTGAVIIALGHNISGLMTNDEQLAEDILKASEKSKDRVWRLPIDEQINELLNSNIADMLNSPNERIAGTIIAASFLSRFTAKYRWAHLDIAGTAWISGKNRTATGRPVPLLIELLREMANAS